MFNYSFPTFSPPNAVIAGAVAAGADDDGGDSSGSLLDLGVLCFLFLLLLLLILTPSLHRCPPVPACGPGFFFCSPHLSVSSALWCPPRFPRPSLPNRYRICILRDIPDRRNERCGRREASSAAPLPVVSSHVVSRRLASPRVSPESKRERERRSERRRH